MARPMFYATQDSYVLAVGGTPVAGIPVRIWARQAGGNRVTDLMFVNTDGTIGAAVPDGLLISNAHGLLPSFAGPDNGPTTLWGDHGLSGERVALTAGPGSGPGGSVSSVDGQIGAVTLDTSYARKAATWASGVGYVPGELVVASGVLHRCVTGHTSAGSINLANFTAIGGGGATVTLDADGSLVVDGTTIELGTDTEIASAIAAAVSGKLTATANFSDVPDPAAARANLGLGTAATRGVGTSSGTVTAGDDPRLADPRTPTGAASGDLGGTYPAPTVAAVNGVTVTGAPTAGQVLTATTGTVATWSTPSGTTPDATPSVRGVVQLAGDLAGTAAAPTVAAVNGVTVTGTPAAGQVITAASGTTAAWSTPSGTTPDATGAVNGVVRLAGDLAGTAAAPVVSAVNGTTVPATPTAGQVLTASSPTTATWQTPAITPTATTTSTGTVTLAGDLAGTSAIPTVTAVNGTTVPATPTTGQVLTATSGTAATWQTPTVTPPATTTTTGTVTLAGGLAGTAGTPTVVRVQAVDVTATAPTAGQVLTAATSTTAAWQTPATTPTATTTTTGTVTLTGDLAGTSATPTVTRVNGTSVPATPATGQVLTATSPTTATWQTPAAVPDATTTTTGVVQLTAGLAGTATAPTVVRVQAVDITSTAPTAGQVLQATTGTAAGWVTPAATPAATTTTAGTVTLDGDLGGTATAPAVLKINGINVTGVPAAGMVLTASTATAASWVTPTTTPDATSSVKGVVQLANALSGTATAPTVVKVQGVDVTSTAPTAGQVLTAATGTTAAWQTPATTPTATTTTTGTVTLAGDLAGDPATPTVARINGVTVTGTPAAGMVPTATAVSAATWQALPATPAATTTTTGTVTLAGDLAGTSAEPTVARINGVTVAGVPTAGQVPTATTGTAAAWATPPTTPTATTTTTGTVTLGGDLAGTASAPTVARVNGVTVTGTPTAGQVIQATTATAAAWVSLSITGQYVGSAATFAALPITDAGGQPIGNGDWAMLTAATVGTGTSTAPQYPRGAYVHDGTMYSLAVSLGADLIFGTTAGTIPDAATVVTLTGAQTVDGVKTLTSSPVIPTPTAGDNSTRAATTAYVDTAAALATPRALYAAKGALAAGTAADTPATVPVGTDGQVLTADAATATGVRWSTPTTPAFADRGAWAAATLYAVGDVVTHAGLSYIAATAGTSPGTFAADTARWTPVQVRPGFRAVTASTTWAVGDETLNCTGAAVITLPQAATIPAGSIARVSRSTTGVVSVASAALIRLDGQPGTTDTVPTENAVLTYFYDGGAAGTWRLT